MQTVYGHLSFLRLSEVRVGFGAPNYVATEGDGLANGRCATSAMSDVRPSDGVVFVNTSFPSGSLYRLT